MMWLILIGVMMMIGVALHIGKSYYDCFKRREALKRKAEQAKTQAGPHAPAVNAHD